MSLFSRSLMRTAARPHVLRSPLRLQSNVVRLSSVPPTRSASTFTSSGGKAGSSSSSWSTVAAVAVASVAAWGVTNSTNKIQFESAPSQAKRKSYAERMSVEGRTKKEEGTEEKPKKKETKEEADEADERSSSATHDEESPIDLDELSEEASQQSAFDPETGTINWDCPCLGGMADGPCGEEFKQAFSCFVFSEADPKGIDCVEKFKAMQGCFRRYPDHYKEELEDEEEGEQLDAAKGGEQKTDARAASTEEDEDEGVREWRSELAKEGKA